MTDVALKHGTHQRWESGCDCESCRFAMSDWIVASTIAGGPRFTLSSILTFRTRRDEFYFTTRMVSRECVHSHSTARRHINELVRLGVLSRVPVKPLGFYCLNFDILRPRPELIEYRESHRIHLVRGTSV
jgi:hypothetical protein